MGAWQTFFPLLIPFVSRGLAGAAVNAFVTNKKQKLDVSLSIIKDFFSMYDDLGFVKGIFVEPDITAILDKPRNLQLLYRVGDWFHYVVSLDKEKIANHSLLHNVGVLAQAEDFVRAVNGAMSRFPRYLDKAWTAWPNLKDFRDD